MKVLFPVLVCLSMFCLTTGCDRDATAARERAERNNALFSEAVAAADRGDAASARSLYEEILANDPQNSAAHLGLGMLLQDVEKDYLSAIFHYRQYVALQPESDKVAMVKGREAATHTLLASALSADIVKRSQQALTTERDALAASLTSAQGEISSLKAAEAAKNAEIETLKRDIEQLRKLVESLRSAEAKVQEEISASKAELDALRMEAQRVKEEEEANAKASEIDSIRKQAEIMLNEEDGGQSLINEATRDAAEGQDDAEKYLTVPTSGKSYLVRPGDTLSKLAREAYGNSNQWRRIQEANRSTTNPDGRLKAGQVILIP